MKDFINSSWRILAPLLVIPVMIVVSMVMIATCGVFTLFVLLFEILQSEDGV